MSTERPYAPPDSLEDADLDVPELGEKELDFREMRQDEWLDGDGFFDDDLFEDDELFEDTL